MSAVEPRLKVIHVWSIVLLENIDKVVLTPTEDGSLLETFEGDRPDEVATLSLELLSGERREARKHRVRNDET